MLAIGTVIAAVVVISNSNTCSSISNRRNRKVAVIVTVQLSGIARRALGMHNVRVSEGRGPSYIPLTYALILFIKKPAYSHFSPPTPQ